MIAQVSKQLLPVLIQGFESLSLRGQAAWIVDSAHSVWSILLGLPALGLLLSSSSWTSALQPRDAAPAVLVRRFLFQQHALRIIFQIEPLTNSLFLLHKHWPRPKR